MIILGLSVVLPLFVVMSIGYLSRIVKLIDDSGVGVVNRLVFWVFLPAILFVSVYETNLQEAFNFPLVLFSTLGTTVVFLISFFLLPKLQKKRDRCGVIIQGLIRGNEVYFGFPIVVSLIGSQYLGLMSIVVAFAVLFYNGYSIFALEYFKGDTVDKREISKNLITNPFILATIAAVIMNLLGLAIPAVLMLGIHSLAGVATPLALFLLGASFNFTSTRGYLKEVVWTTIFRLIIIPGIVIALSILLGFSSTDTVILFVTFGVPTAVASYSMARQLNADYELASQIVVYTSSFAILTVFLWTIVLQLLQVI
jgi:predicted permease